MKGARKFLRLKGADKRLFLEALFYLVVVRLALTFSTYRNIERHVAPAAPRTNGVGAGRIAWAVRHMAPLVPGATCLTQALAAQHMMHKAGKASTIRIGVKQGDDGQVAAHAWLVWDGKVVIGGASEDLSRYTSIADLAPGSS